MLEVTQLIAEQSRTIAVMFCAGILTESLWRLKTVMQKRSVRKWMKVTEEALFWGASAVIISAFLYYSCFGKIAFTALIGLLARLLLWKKIFRVIIKAGNQGKKNNIH